ncbi:MAG: DUF6529 family protein [Actinomycetota bacterium]
MVLDVASSYEDILESVFSAPIAAKAWLATIAGALALVQIVTAARIYGRLRAVLRLPDAVVSRVHRWSGRVAVLVSLPVVFHCVFILGFQTTSARVAIHSVVGSFLYGVVATKVFIVRTHDYPGWVLPVAGGTLFSVLAALWATSSLWYFTEVRFGF